MAESNAAENQIRRLRKEALIEHVHALRRMLIIIVATVAIVFVAMFYQMSSQLAIFLLRPLVARGIDVIATKVSESLVMQMKVCLVAALIWYGLEKHRLGLRDDRLWVLAGMAVAFVRFFLSLDFMQDFVATYPGEYHLPEGAPVGIPAWLGWQHFFNVFLMVLIIRSGLTIRHEKRPAVFWAPKNNPKGKTSLTIWFH